MKLKNLCITLLTSVVISSIIVGCSDDKPAPSTKAEKPFDPFDHSKDEKISEAEKDKFEKTFVEQCVKKEMLSSPNADKDRFTAPCTCIANEVSKTLTAKESEKFVAEGENPVSLTFKVESAGYQCLQEKAPPKDSGFTSVTQ